jgi:hypothetical protein
VCLDTKVLTKPELNICNLKRHQTPPNHIEFRLPPTFELPSQHAWEPTPPFWFLGTWYFGYSNSLIYQLFQDMQWTLYPTGTYGIDGTLQDLTTEFALNKTSFVFKNYGIDTPTVIKGTPVPDSYTYIPTPPLTFANNTWEVIAWGYDSEGVPYSVLYETPADGGLVGPSLDIISRSDKGPSKPTLDTIYDGIKDLHNDALDALLKNVVKLPQNGGRNGQLFPSCNATCQTNGALSPGSARQIRKAMLTCTMCSIRVWRGSWNWRCLGIRHIHTSKFQRNCNPNFCHRNLITPPELFMSTNPEPT